MKTQFFLCTVKAASSLTDSHKKEHVWWSWDGVNAIVRAQFHHMHGLLNWLKENDGVLLTLNSPTPVGDIASRFPASLGVLPTDTAYQALNKISSQHSDFHPEGM